ncbi:MAG: sugar transferase [Candidatus Eisenbacteria bacterium]
MKWPRSMRLALGVRAGRAALAEPAGKASVTHGLSVPGRELGARGSRGCAFSVGKRWDDAGGCGAGVPSLENGDKEAVSPVGNDNDRRADAAAAAAVSGKDGAFPARGAHASASDPALSFVPRTFYQRRGKRIIDFLVSLTALILTSPLFLIISLAIRIESKGSPFYLSTRLGRRARPFRFIKFRSMVVGAETMKDCLQHLNEMDGPVFKIRKDPRMTRMGRLLRRTSLDELPQLINVLRGEMSLVGPRPPIPEEVEHYEPWQRRRLAVTPGITCLWQVSGRNKISFAEWMEMDMVYVDHLGPKMDLKVLLLTLPAVLKGVGAS